MNRSFRLILSLFAVLAMAALAAGCGGGGVPEDAVAEVDGEAIDKSSFDHWMTVAAKGGGQANAQVPDAPQFTRCVADKRKTAPKPAKGQPKTTDKQLRDQCRQEYNAMRDQVMTHLISIAWIEGEAAERGIKLSSEDVRKKFEEQKKLSFPKDADFQKFLKDSGQTQEDILVVIRRNELSTRIRDRIIKGKDKVSDAQIKSYYDKNKAQFAQPEQRDIRMVLTKNRARAAQARDALESGQSWASVVKTYSIDEATKAQGGRLTGIAKGQQEQALDDAVFGARKGALQGPVKTAFGWYVFEVTKVTEADQRTLKESEAGIRQVLVAENQQKALDAFIEDFRAEWREKTECGDGFKIQDCSNGPKPTPTPDPAAAPTTPTPGN